MLESPLHVENIPEAERRVVPNNKVSTDKSRSIFADKAIFGLQLRRQKEKEKIVTVEVESDPSCRCESGLMRGDGM